MSTSPAPVSATSKQPAEAPASGIPGLEPAQGSYRNDHEYQSKASETILLLAAWGTFQQADVSPAKLGELNRRLWNWLRTARDPSSPALSRPQASLRPGRRLLGSLAVLLASHPPPLAGLIGAGVQGLRWLGQLVLMASANRRNHRLLIGNSILLGTANGWLLAEYFLGDACCGSPNYSPGHSSYLGSHW